MLYQNLTITSASAGKLLKTKDSFFNTYIPTSERPDLVMFDRTHESVLLAELTVPFESHIDSAHERKSEKYASLRHDIQAQGFSCDLICFEIGTSGLVTKENKRRITRLFRFVKDSSKMQSHIKTISKIAILTSFAIYNARKEPTWSKPTYLLPHDPSR